MTAASKALGEDQNIAPAILSAWLAPRVTARRRLVPDFKRLMKLS
ncbi:hypothetical protein [Sphingomonas sp. EC-HK361]|nr:hypothetical protein [Sphingomonas sp. EC-HK361]